MNNVMLILIIFSGVIGCNIISKHNSTFIETQREYCDINDDGKTFSCRYKKQLCFSDDGYSCRVIKKRILRTNTDSRV